MCIREVHLKLTYGKMENTYNFHIKHLYFQIYYIWTIYLSKKIEYIWTAKSMVHKLLIILINKLRYQVTGLLQHEKEILIHLWEQDLRHYMVWIPAHRQTHTQLALYIANFKFDSLLDKRHSRVRTCSWPPNSTCCHPETEEKLSKIGTFF